MSRGCGVSAFVAACGLAVSVDAHARPTVSWGNAAGGSWTIPTNWVGNAAPTSVDDALIDLLGAGSYTVNIAQAATAASLTLNSVNATVSHSSNTLNLNGGLLNLLAGTYTLTGGTLANAVLSGNAFSTPSGGNGTLNGCTLNTTLNLNSGYTLNISNGLTVNAGRVLSVNAAAGFTILEMLGAGNQTIGGSGEVVFNGTGSTGFVRANSGNLVIGQGVTVRSGAQGGNVGQFGMLTNHGVIASRTANQTINVGATGGWSASATGTLEASSGGTLTLANAWSNAGTFLVNGGTLNLGGTFSTPSVDPARWNRTGGTVNITGTLNNAGNTFTLNSQNGSMNLAGGTISGGTIFTDGASLLTPNNSAGTFTNGVTLDGNLGLGSGYTLSVSGGLTVNAGRAVSLNTGGGFTVLDFLGAGAQNLAGDGEVVFNGTTNSAFIRANAGNLVIGQNMTVRSGAQGGNVGQFGMLTNHGTIAARTAGRTVNIGASGGWSTSATGTLEASNGGTLTLANAWTNTGTLLVDGGTMNLGGTFAAASVAGPRWNRTGGTVNLTGAMNNAGNTFTLNAQTGSFDLRGGTITGGTIATADGAAFVTPSGSNGTLAGGVTLDTDMTLGQQYTLSASGGLTINPGRTLSINGGAGFSVLDMLGAGDQTISGGGVIEFNGSTTSGFVRANSGTLVVGPDITIRSGARGGQVSQSGSLRNRGAIVSQTNGQTITLAGANLHNEGSITAENGGTISITRATGLTSNTGDPLIARTGGRINFTSGLTASNNGPITLELSSGSPTTGYGRITVTGNAVINGSDINLVLAGGFNPDWGDSFNILSYSALLGDMSSLVLPTLSDPVNLRWWRTQTASAFTIGVRILADTNHDNVVDFLDLNNVLSFFGQSGVGLAGDANEDGVVDFLDLNHVLSDFGRSAPPNPVPAPAGVALAMPGLGLAGGRRRSR